jgi:hypothetical protein
MLPLIQKDYNKQELAKIADNCLNELLDNGRILETHEFITKMEFFIKKLKDNPEYYNYLSYEVAKYGSAHTTSTGTKMELAEVGVKYDYVFCEDDTYNELVVKRMSLDEQIKDREKFLKSIPTEGIEIVDMDGIVKRVYPPSKSSTSSVKTTISK